MNRRHPARRAAVLLRVGFVALLSFAVLSRISGPATAAYSQIEGSGSTWSYTILQQWIADVSANGMQITFNNNGSSQGRKDFANYVTDFGISEIPYQGTDPVTGQADSSSRPYAYLPIVAGGTAFTYQLKVAGKLVKNLRLSGETIAKIFTNQITNWNDPAITKDNNGRQLPSLPITPVVRSDGSGTTAQFTRWLDNQYGSVWRPYFGKSGLTSQFPRKGRQIAASGSDQVMNTIDSAAGNGTIGYVEYSYPLNAHYPVVYVKNKSGYYVQPTQYNVAVALQKAQIDMNPGTDAAPNLNYLTQVLDNVYTDPDSRAYPISSYSYMIIPTSNSDRRMTVAKRQTLADFLTYSLCSGQTKAGPYGYSPLPLNLAKAGLSQVEKLGPQALGGAVDGVSIKDTSSNLAACDNPTFVKGNLSANHLADIAPKPLDCQKEGAGPCGETVVAPGTTTKAGSTESAPSTPAAPAVDSAPTGDTPVAADPGASAPDATAGTADDTATTTTAGAATASPITLTSQRSGDNKVFGGVAVLEVLAIVMIPGLYVAMLRRRKGSAR